MPPTTLNLLSTRDIRDVLFNEMSDGVIVLNRQGVVVDCNPAFHRALGYEKDDLIGEPVANLDTPEFAPYVPMRMKQILCEGHATFETAYRCKDGSTLSVELNSRLFTVGKDTYFYSIARDISLRKHLEEQLKNQFAIYNAAINTPALGFWVANHEGRFIEVNDAYVRQSGYSRDELLTMSIADVEALEKPEETKNRIEMLKREGHGRFRSAHRRKDGSVWPVEIVTSYSDIQGGLFIVFIEDITERKKAEAALQRAHDELEDRVEARTLELTAEIATRQKTEAELRKLSRAVEHSAHMIFITDADGIIEYVNPKFTEWLGYSTDEAIGQKPSLIKSGDTPAGVYGKLWETILSGVEWHGELKDRAKDGSTFWASAAIAPVRDERDRITHFIAVHENITDRKKAELATIKARKAAEAANQAKSDLMANMSHELRTPLNAIIGFSETMRGELFGPLGDDKYKEYAEYIHDSGTHLLALINDILDVSAVEANKLELREAEVDLVTMCDTVLLIVEPHAQENGVTVTGIENGDLPLVWADPLRIKQILLNLLSNAVKFTPEGGSVSCSAAIDSKTGDMVVRVTDTGIGMDKAGLKKALSKFGQVDSSLSRTQTGTGLGLPLVKGLVELHGGTLELKSRLGKGTAATVRLPASRLLDVFPED